LISRINRIKEKDKRIIIGIEGGDVPETLNAALVEVSGCGNDTVLYLHSFSSYPLPAETRRAIESLDKLSRIKPEEATGVNFLLLHNISLIFQDIIQDSGLDDGKRIDLIGLNDFEIGGTIFPIDPGVLSEMLDCIVACRFCICSEFNELKRLPVRELILKSMLDDMINRFGLEEDVREAAAVALLANEALFHEEIKEVGGGSGVEGERKKAIRTKKCAVKKGKSRTSYLFGEFYFPD